MRRAAAAPVVLLACVASAADPQAVLLVADNGHASPVACWQKGAFSPGLKCKGGIRARLALKDDEGRPLTTGAWDPKGTQCPWAGGGGGDDRAFEVGTLASCRGRVPCDDDESPPRLAVPALSKTKLWPKRLLEAKRFPDQNEQAALAALVGRDPKALEPSDGFEVDLDGDGKPDRLVQLRGKRTPQMRRTEVPEHFTFLLIDGAPAKQLVNAGCGSPDYLGASDLDGDGKPELVFRFQYQVILFKGDGSVLVANPECCGEG